MRLCDLAGTPCSNSLNAIGTECSGPRLTHPVVAAEGFDARYQVPQGRLVAQLVE